MFVCVAVTMIRISRQLRHPIADLIRMPEIFG